MKRVNILRAGATKFDEKSATSLLFPIATFFRSAGLSATAAERSFDRAMRRAARLRTPRTMENIGHSTVYADVVARWRRDARFLDSAGSPRDLPLAGRNGFAALVHSIGARASAKTMLAVLSRYGNVKKLSDGKYRLINPFFFITSPSAMAFEPMASFLCDVTSTFNQIVRRSASSREPKLFWRKVESVSVPNRAIDEFITFIGHRSLTFLEEIDDWLEAHAGDSHSRVPRRRVGLGLFSIYSEPQASHTDGRS